MPPRTKVAGGLVGFTASDSEPDFDDVVQTKVTLSEQPVKRPRGRPPAASKVTKPVQKQGRSNSVRPVGRGQASPRRALADKSSNTIAAKKSLPEKMQPDHDVVMLEAQNSSPAKPARTVKRKPKGAKETTPVEEEEDTTGEAETMEGERMEVETERYQPFEMEEDASDATIRRKLGDLTRKYESLEARYRELRQVGVVEAERNFERLQKQADESAAAATKLINELKAELAAQTSLVKKGEEVREQLERSETKCASLQSEVSDTSASLTNAKLEIKKLSTKLAVLRSAEATVAVPGSALKAGAAGNRAIPPDVQTARAKEDLFGDLTGLILGPVSLGKDEDVFDCIQTGGKGTLHFKLAVDKGDNYDDVQFTYSPQFDESRDEKLMDKLPYYLKEEITFTRTFAASFHAKVIHALTK